MSSNKNPNELLSSSNDNDDDYEIYRNLPDYDIKESINFVNNNENQSHDILIKNKLNFDKLNFDKLNFDKLNFDKLNVEKLPPININNSELSQNILKKSDTKDILSIDKCPIHVYTKFERPYPSDPTEREHVVNQTFKETIKAIEFLNKQYTPLSLEDFRNPDFSYFLSYNEFNNNNELINDKPLINKFKKEEFKILNGTENRVLEFMINDRKFKFVEQNYKCKISYDVKNDNNYILGNMYCYYDGKIHEDLSSKFVFKMYHSNNETILNGVFRRLSGDVVFFCNQFYKLKLCLDKKNHSHL